MISYYLLHTYKYEVNNPIPWDLFDLRSIMYGYPQLLHDQRLVYVYNNLLFNINLYMYCESLVRATKYLKIPRKSSID